MLQAFGPGIDRLTQAWVRGTGRPIDLTNDAWLDGPFGAPTGISDDWIEREASRLGARVMPSDPSVGLVPSMDRLGGDGFSPGALQPEVTDFYERTTSWRLELWSQWCPAAWPFGWLISAIFARRLQQLSLPLRPLDVSRGIDSRVVPFVDPTGETVGTAWLRTLRATGATVYSGCYGVTRLPQAQRPSVRVVFPLPNGSVTVFLRPEVMESGGLRLVSPLGRFGDNGAYLVVRDGETANAWVRRVPIVEEFRVYVDDERTLRTDHDLRLWRIPVIQLHYRIDRVER